MKKITTLVLLTFISSSVLAQSLFVKTESSVEGMPAMVAKLSKSSSTSFYKDNRVKTEIKTMMFSQVQITETDKVTIFNSAETNCAIITKAELLEDSLENDVYATEVQIEKTNETKKILGYDCVKTIIRYKVANTDSKVVGLESEMTFWTTTAVIIPKTKQPMPELMKKNALTVAIQSVEGFPMQIETWMKANGVKTIGTVTEINTKDIKESEFELDSKKCKKTMNLKEYKKYLLKKKLESQRYTGY